MPMATRRQPKSEDVEIIMYNYCKSHLIQLEKINLQLFGANQSQWKPRSKAVVIFSPYISNLICDCSKCLSLSYNIF